jgi:FkbM family methyltransferase
MESKPQSVGQAPVEVADPLCKVMATFGPLIAFQCDSITDEIRKFGAHVRSELAFLSSVVGGADKVFDLGAHIGSIAIPIAQKIRLPGRILAVEGDPSTVQVLTANVSLHSLHKVVSVRHAIVAPKGSRYAARKTAGHTGATYFEPDEVGIDVECTSIDDLCEAEFCPDIIKLDLEGMEYVALAMSEYVKQARPVLYCEVNVSSLGRYGNSPNDLNTFLTAQGYRLFRNKYQRNAWRDHFEPIELCDLSGAAFFDVLALPPGHRCCEESNWS